MIRSLTLFALLAAPLCFAQRTPPTPPTPPSPPVPAVAPFPPGGQRMSLPFGAPGIPAQAAQRAGIPAETAKKVQTMSFDANDALIGLEADLKRAQLDLERTLAASQVDEAVVMNKLEVVGRAELAVRKNRMGLMVRIRKAVGPDAWDRLQAEMPGPDRMLMLMSPGTGREVRREVRVIRDGNGGETVDVHEE